MRTPINFSTPFGIFWGGYNYAQDHEYYEWKKKIAKEFIKLQDEDPIEAVDQILWLEGRAERATDREEKAKLKDLIIAKKMVDSGKDSEESPVILYRGLWENSWQSTLAYARSELKNEQQTTTINIRGIDRNLYVEARVQAVREGKNMGEWLNKAIEYRLAQIKVDEAEKQRTEVENP